MKPEELAYYIGEIDDELITNAKKKRRTTKRLLLIMGSVAACAAIAVTGIFLATKNNNLTEISVPGSGEIQEKGAASTGIFAGGAYSEMPHTEESEDNSVEIITSEIYYVQNGKIESRTETHEATPENVFNLWKKMNNIGDEVKLVSVKIDSNGITEESEIDGQGVATYHVGADLTFNLTITKNIENYYSMTGEFLLLSSLEKTMYEASEIKYGEFNLVLEEG